MQKEVVVTHEGATTKCAWRKYGKLGKASNTGPPEYLVGMLSLHRGFQFFTTHIIILITVHILGHVSFL
jgi:hypothetical protein